MSDIYVVVDGSRVVGASTKLQGAELLRADEARLQAEADPGYEEPRYRAVYDRLTIANTELQDDE